MNRHHTFGPVSGPILSGLAAVLVALLQQPLGFPRWSPFALACLAAAAVALVGVLRGTAPGNTAYGCVCWIAAGGWTWWTASTVVTWWHGLTWVGFVLVAGLLAPVFSGHVPADPAAEPVFSSPLPTGRKKEWADRLVRLSKTPGITVTQLVDWPGGTGFTLDGHFEPESGNTWTKVRDVTDQIGGAVQLPVGCPVTAEIGSHQGAFRLHVSTVNALEEAIDFPTTYAPRSGRNPFTIGQFLDKAPTTIELYQAAGLIVGAREGGKTGLLQNITGNLVQCTDVVVWHVDLNGGGMSAPWVYAYANGQADTPVVDWSAHTADEALLVAQVGLAIARDRKSRYQHLLVKEGTDVLPISAAIPEIIIMVDEGGEVTGSDASKVALRAGQALRELQRIGRAMCVNVVFSQQRATAEYLPSQMKKNATLKICMRVEDDAEIAQLLDWKKGLRAADLVAPGCGYIRRSASEIVRQFKGYWLRPPQIVELSIVAQQWRPQLDQPALAVAGRAYADRWKRAQPWLAALRGESVDQLDQVDHLADVQNQPDPVPGGNLPVVQAGMDVAQQMVEKLRKSGTTTSTAAPAADEPDWLREARAGLDSLPVAEPVRPTRAPAEQPETTSAPADLAERLALVVEIVAGAGSAGCRTGDVITAVESAGVRVSRQTVADWLRKLEQDGKLSNPRQGWWVVQAA